MEILQNIGLWALIIILIVLLWKPFVRFIERVFDAAYNKAVAIGGSIVLLVIASLLWYLFGPK